MSVQNRRAMERNKRMKSNGMRNRSRAHLMSVFVTVFVLSVSFAASEMSFTTRIRGISADLGYALNRVLEFENVTYTEFDYNATYISDVQYNPKGMAGLYNITHWFMDLIQPKEIFPDDVNLTDENDKLELSNLIAQWPSLLKHYAALLSLTILGLLFAVLMPFIGFIFCCCRCCGNCGARSQPFDKKHDMCRKVFLAMLLIGVATLILFGVVCAFVSNQHMQEGTEELPKNLDNSLTDVKTYINHTNNQIDTLLNKNFNELKLVMNNILNNSSQIIKDQIMEYSKAVSFTKLAGFVTGLTQIFTDLQEMKSETNDLRAKASQLNDGLRRVKHELLHSLNSCNAPKCIELNTEIAKLSTTVDFDNLPDVTKTIEELDKIIRGGLIEEIKKGEKSFNDIPNTIETAVTESLPQVRAALNEAGDTLIKGQNDVSKELNKVINLIDDQQKGPIKDFDNYIQLYSRNRYYVGIFISSLLLLVIICVTFGLMCGICGKRPDGYDDDCCNKGAGSKFLMIGVAIMFLFSFVLMIVTIVYFLTGVIAQRLACDTLRSSTNNRVFVIIDKTLDLKNIHHSDLGSVIKSCHYNHSAYKVLHLETYLNMEEVKTYIDKFEIREKIGNLKDKIQLKNEIHILTDDAKIEIEKLVNSGIGDVPFGTFATILSYNLTNIDLQDLANKLNDLGESLKDAPAASDIRNSIAQNVKYLNMYQTNLVEPMITTAESLQIKAVRIELQMKFGQDDFKNAIDATLAEVDHAEKYINKNGSQDMQNIAESFGDSFVTKVQDYLDRTSDSFVDHVGRCGPISNVYNTTLVATCDKILNPWNGFWLSVGCCLILFVPTIILSVKLATLYQKSDPYPGPLVEHEYLYDAYADRDNIPLSNTNAKKGKKKKKRGGEMGVYEARGYPGPESSRGAVGEPRGAPTRERDAPGGSSHPDTRYADMAPKHWEDYPNGGPPQYQSAPLATEYERPPPYYYPGPGDRP